ncbi:hypothetical protein BX661DRAFT_10735 [Kickxella alabastrina]|uniref:uncharacterized protein n=1 Tax=Kickxella alabastrina TaxID=61397 RepID=UPI00221FDD7F|nr:uncharacterized protein BX661DRAFT_10735 [Kickxella alabastrina]KAI7835100.1 hypothetical protein BX661DRAFT_10735 [Kickxella alabastrina]
MFAGLHLSTIFEYGRGQGCHLACLYFIFSLAHFDICIYLAPFLGFEYSYYFRASLVDPTFVPYPVPFIFCSVPRTGRQAPINPIIFAHTYFFIGIIKKNNIFARHPAITS